LIFRNYKAPTNVFREVLRNSLNKKQRWISQIPVTQLKGAKGRWRWCVVVDVAVKWWSPNYLALIFFVEVSLGFPTISAIKPPPAPTFLYSYSFKDHTVHTDTQLVRSTTRYFYRCIISDHSSC